MNSERQDPTITEYLGVIRQHWLLVIATTIVSALAGLAYSIVQTPTYKAEASVAVQDVNQDIMLLGGTGGTNQTPDQLAAAHVPEVTRPAVLQAVSADLNHSMTPAAVNSAVDVHVDPSSDLVLIDASARTGRRAADIANAVAGEDSRLSNAEARQTFASEASTLATKIASLKATQDPTTRLVYVDQLAHLQSLSVVAAPVEVSSTASIPGSPASPKPLLDVLAAALLGLFVGIAGAFGRHAIDRRLRSPDDVQLEVKLPLLGYVHNDALGHAGILASNGRSVVAPSTDMESYRILRQNLEFMHMDDGSRCILVTSAIAQEGKSTVAAGLALASAGAGKRTLLLECDLRRPVLAGRLGLNKQPGLIDVLAGQSNLEDVVQAIGLAAPESRNGAITESRNGALTTAQDPFRLAAEYRDLACVTAGSLPPQPAQLLGSHRFQAMLSDLLSAYEVLVIDSSPMLPLADTLELLPRASAVVICVRYDITRRDQARSARAVLERAGVTRAGVVVTGVRRGRGYYGYYGSEYYSSHPAVT